MLKKRIQTRKDFTEPDLPPSEFLFEWAIGKFFTEFSELELAICQWLSEHLKVGFEKVLVLTKDANFNQKIDMVRNVCARLNGQKKDGKLLERLREVNDFRNRLAHGAYFHFENELFLSMPSKDFLDVSGKQAIDNEIIINKLNQVRELVFYFSMHLRDCLET
ncbi:hypothetical protein AB4097_20045 [Microvirga sp. 2MCAF35]|uniref:hypothetical protein n=1 Tax=Microvirga sp. 2MCAF35 TaxID=3232987 RepID=UPI003F992874